MQPKKLFFIPILLLIFSGIILYNNKITEGSIIKKDIDLKGGTLITIETSEKVDSKNLQEILTNEFGSVIVSSLKTTTGYGASIQTDENVEVENVLEILEENEIIVNSYSAEIIGSSLGETFFSQVTTVLIIGFVLMGLMMFLVYRNPLPSFGIVFAVGSDIIAAIALTSFFGVSLGFAGFISLLMFIAYAVDTNIVLTSSILKIDKKDFEKEYKNALKTGLTITVAIVLTMSIVLFLSTSKLLTNIAAVLVAGFIADIIFTWIFNAGILQMYKERSK